MKAKLANKIAKHSSLYWIRHYLQNDNRCDKAIVVCRRKAHRDARKAGTTLGCNTCRYATWEEDDNDVWRGCSNPRSCHYCNRWELYEI